MDATIEITLAEASALLPRRNGKRVHVKTIKRWIVNGCRGVKLGGWKRGSVWFTTAEELERFRQACTAQSHGRPERTPRQVSDAVLKARQQLQRMGFYGRESKQAAG